MSMPTLARATNTRNADQTSSSPTQPATPPSRIATSTMTLTVEHLSASEMSKITQAINDLSLAEKNRKAARAQIEDAEREIAQARADRAAAKVIMETARIKIEDARAGQAAALAKIEDGRAGQAAAIAEIEAARAKASAARAAMDTLKTDQVQRLEKFKEIVNKFYLVKPNDSATTAKIDAMIQQITDAQANLPDSAAEQKKIFTEIHAAVQTLGKSLKPQA